MDRLNAIRLFVRLVERGSFSAVGREEGIGQPAVSKQIAALERHLGAQLVLRTSRQVAITDAGQAFYESARRLVDDAEALEASVGMRQQAPHGLVRISTAPAHGRLCVTPLLPEFFRRYPHVTVELTVSERPVDLVADGIDLALRNGRLADSTLTARTLPDTDMVLVASPAYLAARGVPARITDLDAHACIVFVRRAWSFREGADDVAYQPAGAVRTNDAEQVRAAVLSGLGIAQVPRWLLDAEIRSGAVSMLLPEAQPAPLPVHIVYPAGRRVPMRVRVLIDYLVDAFARPPA